jgi:serine/threonine protein kinase
MTPTRREQISQVYQAALHKEAEQRLAFLTQACGGDEELRREVESLLAYQQQDQSFLSSPALAAVGRGGTGPAPLPVGSEISHYQILARLGEGGMGVVYKARDKQLGRLVALKVLPAGLVADPEHRKRLVQEARMASALNHPNIITVYEIASDHGMDFIVMEYVAGKSLDQLIPRKGLRLSQALKFAIQIAEALAAVHATGIMHRDLKPGNVMVSESGLVKVLDFGLAKLTMRTGNEGSDATTLLASGSGPQTAEGTILGTLAYMSPEEAEGKPVDARSDIFSFGSLLYEMVTGRRAFTGETNLATQTAILREDPKPASQIIDDVPHDLEKIIDRCLRKDRERRAQTMADVEIALQELKEESDSGRLGKAVTPQRGLGRGLAWAAGPLGCCRGFGLVLSFHY